MAQEIAAFFRFVDANPQIHAFPLVFRYFGCSNSRDMIHIGGHSFYAGSIMNWVLIRRDDKCDLSAEDHAALIAGRLSARNC